MRLIVTKEVLGELLGGHEKDAEKEQARRKLLQEAREFRRHLVILPAPLPKPEAVAFD